MDASARTNDLASPISCSIDSIDEFSDSLEGNANNLKDGINPVSTILDEVGNQVKGKSEEVSPGPTCVGHIISS